MSLIIDRCFSSIDPSANNNKALMNACTNHNSGSQNFIQIVKLLLEDSRTDPSVHDNYAMNYSVHNGNVEILKLLLQDSRVDPSNLIKKIFVNKSYNSYEYGNLKEPILKLLLENYKGQFGQLDYNFIFQKACECGHADIVQLILEKNQNYLKIRKEKLYIVNKLPICADICKEIEMYI